MGFRGTWRFIVRVHNARMRKSETHRRLRDEYKHPGFYPSRYVEIPKWVSDGRILRPTRRSKKLFAVNAARSVRAGMITGRTMCEIFPVPG
jgi:hypothetical protein